MKRSEIRGTNTGGEVSTIEAFRMLVYCSRSHGSIASAARSAIERYVELVSLDSLSYTFDGAGDPVRLNARHFVDLMDEWFIGRRSQWGNATIELVGSGGNLAQFALTYCGDALNNDTLPDNRGYLDMWVPRQFHETHAEELERFFVDTAQDLHACSGYMSPALTGDDTRSKQALAARYMALDISVPGCVSIDMGNKSPGSYWYNYLGAGLICKLRHVQNIGRVLGEVAEVKILSENAMTIRLGAMPEVGDRNHFEELPAYEAFARLLHSNQLLHVPQHCVYFKDRLSLADREAQNGWHLRFVEQ